MPFHSIYPLINILYLQLVSTVFARARNKHRTLQFQYTTKSPVEDVKTSPPIPERGLPKDQVARIAGHGHEHRQYRQTVGPSWSDSEEEENPSQHSNHRSDHRLNEYGEPLSPPPPYSEQDYSLGGDPTWSHDRINLYPGEGGRADYVIDSSGRRERYVVDGFGHRVPWPFVDRENSSYNGEEDPDMIYLESGRVLPRSEWDEEHPVEYSSGDPADDREQDTSQSRRAPRLESRSARH